jgi:folate-binding protein YgfZ
LLELPGAIAAPEGSPDAGVAWHHGDPFAEQRTAARTVAVFDRSHRGVLAVPGTDRLTWLHSLTSQHFEQLAQHTGTEALLLDAQGRVERHLLVAHERDTVWLDTEPGHAAPLLTYLEKMRFWSQVAPADAGLAVLTLVGPDTATVLDLPESPYGVAQVDDAIVRRMPWPGVDAADVLVPRDRLAHWWQRLTGAGARPAGSWAFEALRVEALRPRLGIDTDEKTIPHEVNWLAPAVHLNKGCYRGQETVARVYNLGRPPRRLVLLHLDGSPEVLPETGDPVLLGDRVVGRVGTVIRHHELGSVALALVKRSVPADAELIAGVDDTAVQAAIDPDSLLAEDADAGAGRAAVQRLRN